MPAATTKKTAKKASAKVAKKKGGKKKASPKAPKGRTQRATPADRVQAKQVGITPNQLLCLKALKDGKSRTAAELAEITGIVKGKRLPELFEQGLTKIEDMEGERSYLHTITAAGKKALTNSSKVAK